MISILKIQRAQIIIRQAHVSTLIASAFLDEISYQTNSAVIIIGLKLLILSIF